MRYWNGARKQASNGTTSRRKAHAERLCRILQQTYTRRALERDALSRVRWRLAWPFVDGSPITTMPGHTRPLQFGRPAAFAADMATGLHALLGDCSALRLVAKPASGSVEITGRLNLPLDESWGQGRPPAAPNRRIYTTRRFWAGSAGLVHTC